MTQSNDYIEARVEKLGARLEKIYAQASEELTDKVNSFIAKYEQSAAEKRKLVEAGKLTQKEYETWRKNKILMSEKYMDLRDTMAQRMTEANKIAAKYINGELPDIYAHNYNQVGKDAQALIKGFSFDIVDENTVRRLSTSDKTLLPYKLVDGHRDVRWNSQRVNGQILQGILQGESIPKIAGRLMKVTKMNYDSAVRNARTAITGAENRGRLDGMRQLEKDGVVLKKRWLAALDDRTRIPHADLHNVEVGVDEPFENTIGLIMYPGDPNAAPENVYNCRCTITEVVVGFRKKEEYENEPEENSNNQNIYEQF